MLVIKSLFIDRFKGFNNIEINFNTSLSVIVGENGTGKTTILETIFNMLSGKTEYFKLDEKFTFITLQFETDSKHYTLTYKKDEEIKIILNDKNVLKDEIQNQFKVIYLPSESTFKDKKIEGVKLLQDEGKNIILDSETMSNRLKQFLLNQFFKDLNDMQKGIQEEAIRIKKFKKLYNEFFIDKEFIEINDDIFEPIFKDKKTGSLLKVNELSSGEKQIFFRGGSLLENIEDNTIVLIDEPEISLHPEWQQRILEFYKNINQDNQYIFSTHSPHIVSCCKMEELIVLHKEDDGKIVINKDIENPYALPTDLLLLSIFNLNTIRNQKVEKIIDRYKELSSREELLNEEELQELQKVKKQMKEQANPKDIEIKYLDQEPDTTELEEILKELGGNIDA